MTVGVDGCPGRAALTVARRLSVVRRKNVVPAVTASPTLCGARSAASNASANHARIG
jgi:hypothetical protein